MFSGLFHRPKLLTIKTSGGLNDLFYLHPENWGNDPKLTNDFQMGWFNHQLKKI